MSWMWYIIPQLKGLGRSSYSDYYGISNIEEAKAFLCDPKLGTHSVEINNVLLLLKTDWTADVRDILMTGS